MEDGDAELSAGFFAGRNILFYRGYFLYAYPKKFSQTRMNKCIQTKTPGNHYLAEAVLGASDTG